MISGSPCKGCNDRRLGCHADCKAYSEWAADNEAERQALRADKLVGSGRSTASKRGRKWTRKWQ